ncbi:hypothetical protein ACF05T_15190 [Streptomyces lateritius]|uniref:Uncharacterized protein n=1 Tax=Streptomyces lateritius TaxID=67313 RepID=A0ABW6YCA0_9ACTN
MAKKPESSQPSHGEGPSRHQGKHQHGWAPDVDETRQQDNPSAHRSFHPDEYAPEKGPGRKASREEKKPVPGDAVESLSDRGEDHAKAKDEEGMHDRGRKGRSRRPSGSKDASAFTGVDPQDPPDKHKRG